MKQARQPRRAPTWTYLARARREGYLWLARPDATICVAWLRECEQRQIPCVVVHGDGDDATMELSTATAGRPVRDELLEVIRNMDCAQSPGPGSPTPTVTRHGDAGVTIHPVPIVTAEMYAPQLLEVATADVRWMQLAEAPPPSLVEVRELVALVPRMRAADIQAFERWPGVWAFMPRRECERALMRAIWRHPMAVVRWCTMPPADHEAEPCPVCGSTERWEWLDGRAICRICTILDLQPLTLGATAPRIPAETRPQTFCRWLRAQRRRQDAIGDLARDASRDPQWGRRARTLRSAERYLVDSGACTRAILALRRAWAEYAAITARGGHA
ncbi:MAG TPA: YozE family protein [Alphaproteobacteria bacterium]|nr:YozE family protein [Alphaproteobacteria bacterium]